MRPASRERFGGLLERAVDEFAQTPKAEAVLLLGDTLTVPVFCLAARQARIPVIHLEAGLRSFNETSMEEVNRKVAAATGQLHLAPPALAERFLRAEGVPAERIRVVGNTVIVILRTRGARPVPPEERRGVLVTAHNHGFAVDGGSLPAEREPTMLNLNDGTNEGFSHRELPIRGVQFHPEASPGPFDARYLFSEWLELLRS